MTIRFATPSDVPALVKLGKHMHAITRFRKFDYDEARVAQTLMSALVQGKDRYVCFVADDSQGEVVGGLLAVLENHIFSQQLTASIMHYDVLLEKRMGGYGVRLLKVLSSGAGTEKSLKLILVLIAQKMFRSFSSWVILLEKWVI